jgi:hypothetical protein
VTTGTGAFHKKVHSADQSSELRDFRRHWRDARDNQYAMKRGLAHVWDTDCADTMEAV